MKLQNNELFDIRGGAIGGWIYGVLAGLAGLITLAVGIIDGYMNPQKCNN